MEWFGKQRTVWILRVLVVAVLLLACPAGHAAKTVITYAFWGDLQQTNVEQEIIRAFEAANPDIKVQALSNAGGSSYSNYHEKLTTLFASGLAPDVMRIDSYFFADYAAANLLLPIDNLLGPGSINLKEYFPIALDDVRYGGKTYGLPWGSYPMLRFYNQDLFDQAGLNYPTSTWTWDEYVTAAKRLTRSKGDRVVQWGTEAPSVYKFVLPTVWSFGGQMLSNDRTKFLLNQPAAVAGLQREIDLIHMQGAAPQDTNWHELFMRGELGMGRDFLSMSVTFTRQGLGFRWDVHPDPVGPAGQASLWKGNVTAISRTSKNPEAAWKFLQFLLGPTSEGTNIYLKHKRMAPQTPDGRMWRLFADPNQPPVNVAKVIQYVAMNSAHALQIREGWSTFDPVIDQAYRKARDGGVSAQAAMDEIAQKVQLMLDSTKKR